jgi:hypothetical protein
LRRQTLVRPVVVIVTPTFGPSLLLSAFCAFDVFTFR